MNKGKSYNIGDIVEGKVTGIQPYVVFVQLADNQQGLIHISEVNHHYVSDINDYFSIGDEIQVQVIDHDEYTRKLSLSVRSLKPLHVPNHPKRLGRPPKRKTPDIGFQSIADEMPGWINEGLKNCKKYQG